MHNLKDIRKNFDDFKNALKGRFLKIDFNLFILPPVIVFKPVSITSTLNFLFLFLKKFFIILPL